MRKRNIFFLSLGALVVVAAIAAPILLSPGPVAVASGPVAPLDAAEQAAIIEAMRPTKRERPVIAIVARNAATEVSDLFSAYGVLKRADVADVTLVAEKKEPIHLFETVFTVDPEDTFAAFDQQHPDGADYVVVPAMDPGTDPVVADWIVAQKNKGAMVVSICNGSKTVGFAGLLDGRRATGHWSALDELQKKYPTMVRVPDRRYVVDDGLVTSTGITSNVPVMLALVEAIGGRDVVERVAGELGVSHWDARHHSADFELTTEHKKTYIRNAITIWRQETIAIPLVEGVDEIALGLVADAYSRSELANVVIVSPKGKAVRSKHGLVLHPVQAAEMVVAKEIFPPPPTAKPAMALEAELPRIAARYDRPTAAYVALVMEYPWAGAAAN